jgi:arabinogalactan endo-1,4-beta-galactosidase
MINVTVKPYLTSFSFRSKNKMSGKLAAKFAENGQKVGGEDFKVENTYQMLKEVIKRTKAVPTQNGLGVFYWEPQGARSWSHYGLSCWGSDGKPTKALKAFKK